MLDFTYSFATSGNFLVISTVKIGKKIGHKIERKVMKRRYWKCMYPYLIPKMQPKYILKLSTS